MLQIHNNKASLCRSWKLDDGGFVPAEEDIIFLECRSEFCIVEEKVIVKIC